MNKTISINIAGFVFNIEEQAYEKLSRYLESIKSNFKNEADCDDIMADIEARIAELFHDKISLIKEVIVELDVEEVIVIMGRPEDYISEESEQNFTSQQSENEEDKTTKTSSSGKKRLYRDEKNGSIGGVCTGLGWFFGLDPVLVKIGFILLTILGGSGILLYIILWIVIPEAKTTAEILEMQNEPVTLDSIKDHVQGTKSSIKDGASDAKQNIKKAVVKGIEAGGHVAKTFVKVFSFMLITGGIFAMLLLFIIFFGDSGVLPLIGSEQVENFATLLDIIYPDGRSTVVFFSILLITIIPIFSGILLGFRLLFNVRGKYKRTAIITSIVWFLALGTLTLTGIELGMNFRNEVTVDYDVPVAVDSSNVLYVDVIEDDIFSNYIQYQRLWNYTELVRVEDEKVFLGYPELRVIEKGDAGSFQIFMYKESNGLYHKEAIQKAENIKYDIKTSQNHLNLAPYFSIATDDKLRNQTVIVEIHVPIGKRIKFGNNIDRILVDISDGDFVHDEQFANTIWEVTDQGFECRECKEKRVYNPEID